MFKRLSILLSVVVFASMGLVSAQGSSNTPSDQNPIIVGGTLGLTGAFAQPSAAYKATYDFWLNYVNSHGGILGRQVKMIIYDDESNARTAQQLYQKLINEDHADLLLAPYTTAVGGAIVPIVSRAGKLLWDGGFVSQELHTKFDNIVAAYPYQDIEYAKPLFDYFKTLPASEKPKTIAVATAQNPFTLAVHTGYQGKGGVLNYAKDQGMNVVFDQQYNESSSDYSALIQKAKAANPDVFIALSLPNDAALLAKTMDQLNFHPKFTCFCGSQVTTLPYWRDLGQAGNDMMSTTAVWPNPSEAKNPQDYPLLDQLFTTLQSKFNYQEMPTYGAVALSILQVMQQAVDGAGTLDQQQVRAYMQGKTFHTSEGNLRYNPDGTVQFHALLVQYQKDHNAVIWPPAEATGSVVIPSQ